MDGNGDDERTGHSDGNTMVMVKIMAMVSKAVMEVFDMMMVL